MGLARMLTRLLRQATYAPADAPVGAEPVTAPAVATPAEGPAAVAEGTPVAAEPAATPSTEMPKSLLAPKEGEPPVPEVKPEDKPADKVAEPAAEALKAEDYVIAEGVLPLEIPSDDPIVQAFLKGAAEGGMDNDSVNAVIKELGPQLQAKLNEPFIAWVKMNETWAEAVKADPDIGGAKLDASMLTIQNAMTAALVKPELIAAAHQALETTGAGNNLAIVRLLHAMAMRLTEKPAVQGGGPVAEPKRTAAEKLYPNTRKSG